MKCFYCGQELAWYNDEMLSDLEGLELTDEEDKIVSFYTCDGCGAEYEVYQKCK